MQSTTGEWRALLADLEKRHEAARWRSEEGERENIKGMLEYTRYALTGFERMATEGPPPQDHLTPADFSWLHVSETWAHDEAAGRCGSGSGRPPVTSCARARRARSRLKGMRSGR